MNLGGDLNSHFYFLKEYICENKFLLVFTGLGCPPTKCTCAVTVAQDDQDRKGGCSNPTPSHSVFVSLGKTQNPHCLL